MITRIIKQFPVYKGHYSGAINEDEKPFRFNKLTGDIYSNDGVLIGKGFYGNRRLDYWILFIKRLG